MNAKTNEPTKTVDPTAATTAAAASDQNNTTSTPPMGPGPTRPMRVRPAPSFFLQCESAQIVLNAECGGVR